MKFEIVKDKVLQNNSVETLSCKNAGGEGAIIQILRILSERVCFLVFLMLLEKRL